MTWKICVEKPFQNCERIFPIQQKKVSALISDMENNSNVRKIIVFGSSVTPKCHMGSDVDLYVELEEPEYPIKKSLSFVYDLWTNYTVDKSMLREIQKNGVTVYERN